jgi:hypothetical protein
MANRFFQQFQYSLEKALVHLYAQASFGAAGAPSLNALNSKGITSMVRTGVGAYTLTLTDKYYASIHMDQVFIGQNPAAPLMYIVAASPSDSTPTMQIQFLDAAGVAADPASGDAVRLHMVFKNSSAP